MVLTDWRVDDIDNDRMHCRRLGLPYVNLSSLHEKMIGGKFWYYTDGQYHMI